MDYILGFGKGKAKSPKRKSTSKNISSKKLSKKILDSLSLKKLKVLAKKYKVSCYKKGTKVCVKKSTLLVRIKKSRSINKILKSVSLMKKSKRKVKKASPKRRTSRARFGEEMNPLAPNTPRFMNPLELALGQTYEGQRRHYDKIPSTLISQNFQGTGAGNFSNRMQKHSKNFQWTQGSMGRSSLPSFKNINDPSWSTDPSRFGRYFR